MTSNVYEQTLNHWAKVIEPFFPKDTRFMTVTDNTFCIYIQSPLESSGEESRRLYYKIILAFTDEAVNEYIHNYEPGSHGKADIRLKEFVAAKLKDKMPEHTTVRRDQAPEYWLMTNDLLNR